MKQFPSKIFVTVLFLQGFLICFKPASAQPVIDQKLTPRLQNTPAQQTKVKEIQAREIKKMTSPEAAHNLKWQRVLMGKEKIDGATLIGVKPGSVWSRLGLQNGDVIIRIKGKEVKSVSDLDKAVSNLNAQDSSLDMKVIREKQEILFDYKLNW
jgi:S1-C subfamily serine protease